MAIILWAELGLLAGCDGPLSNSSPSPTAIPNFPSGGIGLTKTEWEQRHTLKALAGCGFDSYDPSVSGQYYSGSQFIRYAYNSYLVNFWREPGQSPPDARVSSIIVDLRRVLSETQHMGPEVMTVTLDLDQQHMAVRAMLPADAQLQKTLPRQTPHIAFREVYYSKSLENAYLAFPSAPNPWKGKAAGIIYVTYMSGQPIALIDADLVSPGPCPSPTPEPPTFTPIPGPPPLPTKPLPALPAPLQTSPPFPLPTRPAAP